MSEFTVTQRVWDLDHWTIMERPIHSDEVYFHGTYPTKEAAEQALKEMNSQQSDIMVQLQKRRLPCQKNRTKHPNHG